MSALAVALFLAGASAAQAQEFTLDVTGSGRHTTLTIGGVIPLDGDVRLEKVLAAHPAVRLVQLDSVGGSYPAGLAMGRRLREAGVNTEVLADATCQSACVFVLAGGLKRRIDPAASIGLHSHGNPNWGANYRFQADEKGFFPLNNNGIAYVVGDTLLMAREAMMHLRQMGVGPEAAETILANPGHGGRMCFVAHPCAVAWKLDNQSRLSSRDKQRSCDLGPSLLTERGLVAAFQGGRFMGDLAPACEADPTASPPATAQR
jgi:hypothetical protein